MIALVFVIGKIPGKSSPEWHVDDKLDGSIETILLQMADEINAKLPQMIDAETRLDSAAGINRKVRYNFTLVNYSAEEIKVPAFNKSMRPKLIKNVCAAKEMAIFLNNDIPVSYAYYGKQGKQITVLTVTASDCSDDS